LFQSGWWLPEFLSFPAFYPAPGKTAQPAAAIDPTRYFFPSAPHGTRQNKFFPAFFRASGKSPCSVSDLLSYGALPSGLI
jgi:hypothetical protein